MVFLLMFGRTLGFGRLRISKLKLSWMMNLWISECVIWWCQEIISGMWNWLEKCSSIGMHKRFWIFYFLDVLEDSLIWHFTKDGFYYVRSTYRLITNTICDTAHLKVMGDWSSIWRMCRDCLPTICKLLTHGVNTSTLCVHCNSDLEDCFHIFLVCSFARKCWCIASLEQEIWYVIDNFVSFPDVVFHVLSTWSEVNAGKFVMIV